MEASLCDNGKHYLEWSLNPEYKADPEEEYKYITTDLDVDDQDEHPGELGVCQHCGKTKGQHQEAKGALSSLSLKNNRLATKEAGRALATALAANSVLKELDLSSNAWEYDAYDDVHADGAGFAQELAVGIKDNGAMTSLNLASNSINAEGAKHIAGALTVSKYVLAVILVPLSCRSDHYFHCWCLLLSAGYGGTIQVHF